ncbi:ABC transporter ATP-binding protein [Nocardia otitidiscaviarum]|uniref:ABC transporter ATP-binding protein n=1 Tax=Nocardia otitidiscaviarum TaxID=1823 RepID=UPI001894CEB2|nr:ABC transporter ATP-binding protein [Nocardia otitidiscaviarum]MBF6241070.1 ABC transporter ATP-binding protein [Nocardia otitidiscaviarum]
MRELIQPGRARLLVAIGCQILAAVAGVVPFVAVAELGRRLLAAESPWPPVIAAAIALAARLGLSLLAASLTHYADNDIQLSIRRSIARHLGRVPLGWFDDRGAGDVRKAVGDDVTALHHLVAHTALEIVNALVVPLVCLVYLFWVDWRMAVITLIPLVIGIELYRRTMAGFGAGMRAYNDAMAAISTSAVEFVQGIAVVKAFGQTGRAHRRYRQAADEFCDFFIAWMRRVSSVSAAANLALSPVSMLAVILVGGTVLVTTGYLDAVDLLPFALLGLALSAPLQTLSQSGQAVQTGMRAATDIRALLATPTLPYGTAAPSEHRNGTGGVLRFENVGFSYDGETAALSDIDLELRPGTVTAVVGASGSGKSTLAGLIPRFHDPDTGRITLDGTDIRELSEETLYRSVGFVFQEVRLVRMSVRDNIALPRPTATLAEVADAAQAAAIDERIRALPAGYDTRDAAFSGGEAQRVSIARALLADAPILVLDEATAAVDPESETAIQQGLSRLAAGRTVLVVAHRLGTITEADQIVVLDRGRVAERGTHAELLQRDGRYAAMWATWKGADA